MFEDILGEENIVDFDLIKKVKDFNPSPPVCDNCAHGSNILSNFPGKVLCQKYRRHKKIDHLCRNWEIRK